MSQNTLMRQYDSSPRKTRVDTRDKRRETTRNCRGCKQRSPSVSSSATSFPAGNECPGTHCGLIEQE